MTPLQQLCTVLLSPHHRWLRLRGGCLPRPPTQYRTGYTDPFNSRLALHNQKAAYNFVYGRTFLGPALAARTLSFVKKSRAEWDVMSFTSMGLLSLMQTRGFQLISLTCAIPARRETPVETREDLSLLWQRENKGFSLSTFFLLKRNHFILGKISSSIQY